MTDQEAPSKRQKTSGVTLAPGEVCVANRVQASSSILRTISTTLINLSPSMYKGMAAC